MNGAMIMIDDKDTRPKPTAQQRRFYLGLSEKLTDLYEQEGNYFWKERPWMDDKTYPKPWGVVQNPGWEAEKALLKKKILKVHEELDKLTKEMYPPDVYPEMYGEVEQPSLIEGVAPIKHNTPKPEPKTVENMSKQELEEIFGGRKNPPEIVATTTAGAEILKRFQERRNRTKGY